MPVGFYFDRLFDWIRLTPSKCNGSERHRYPKSSRSSVWTSGHCLVESVLGLYLCRFINLILGIWRYRTYWVLTAFLLGCQNDQQAIIFSSAPANCRGQGISFRFNHLLSDKLWQKQYVYEGMSAWRKMVWDNGSLNGKRRILRVVVEVDFYQSTKFLILIVLVEIDFKWEFLNWFELWAGTRDGC